MTQAENMRLICPNCDAQYEVPGEVIPFEGRDVQCSNCGQSWFQDHPDALAEAEAKAAATPQTDEEVVTFDDPVPDESSDAPEADDVEAPQEDHAESSADVPATEPVMPEQSQSDKPDEQETGRRTVDPNVASVLREEAELEARARQNELSGSVESQPDLGLADADPLDDASRRAEEARERMARMRGEEPLSEDIDDPSDPIQPVGSRRDLLPDIEEINSTLRSNNDRSSGTDPGQTAQVELSEARSSRRGFILTIALVAVLALLYAYAPQLAVAVPQMDPWLSGYVGAVDQGRSWLDEQVQSILSWLDATAASSNQ